MLQNVIWDSWGSNVVRLAKQVWHIPCCGITTVVRGYEWICSKIDLWSPHYVVRSSMICRWWHHMQCTTTMWLPWPLPCYVITAIWHKCAMIATVPCNHCNVTQLWCNCCDCCNITWLQHNCYNHCYATWPLQHNCHDHCHAIWLPCWHLGHWPWFVAVAYIALLYLFIIVEIYFLNPVDCNASTISTSEWIIRCLASYCNAIG